MKFRLILFGVCVLWTNAVNGAPSNDVIATKSLNNLTETIDVEVPVKYYGAQLWRVNYDNENSKKTISNLQRQFG